MKASILIIEARGDNLSETAETLSRNNKVVVAKNTRDVVQILRGRKSIDAVLYNPEQCQLDAAAHWLECRGLIKGDNYVLLYKLEEAVAEELQREIFTAREVVQMKPSSVAGLNSVAKPRLVYSSNQLKTASIQSEKPDPAEQKSLVVCETAMRDRALLFDLGNRYYDDVLLFRSWEEVAANARELESTVRVVLAIDERNQSQTFYLAEIISRYPNAKITLSANLKTLALMEDVLTQHPQIEVLSKPSSVSAILDVLNPNPYCKNQGPATLAS